MFFKIQEEWIKLEESVFTGPPEVPESWHEVWEYTYTRSWGYRLRATILDIIKHGKLHLFDQGQALSGDIIQLWAAKKK